MIQNGSDSEPYNDALSFVASDYTFILLLKYSYQKKFKLISLFSIKACFQCCFCYYNKKNVCSK